jgi:hypothetical protein
MKIFEFGAEEFFCLFVAINTSLDEYGCDVWVHANAFREQRYLFRIGGRFCAPSIFHKFCKNRFFWAEKQPDFESNCLHLFGMKRIFMILSACISLSVIAQPSITSASMPKAGDTLRYSTASPTSLPSNYQTGGANMSWDFSSMTPLTQTLNNYYGASKTPYGFYFFGQIGQKTADTIGAGPITLTNVYSFYTNSTKVFKAEGIGYQYSGFPLASMYKDDDEIYQFPLNYGDVDTSTFNFKFSIPGDLFALVQSGKRVNNADGWGTIKTPFGEYKDVLRLKSFVDQIDTVTSQFGKFPIPRKTMIYRWLSTTERIPVMEIQGTIVAQTGKFTPTQVRYRDGFIGKLSATSVEVLALKLYPNPGNGVVVISGLKPGDTWLMRDVLGKQIAVNRVGDAGFDSDDLLAGMYYIVVGDRVLTFCKK